MTVSTPRKLSDLRNIYPEKGKPLLLFHEDNHSIYWLGSAERSVFRSNTYFIRDGDQGVLIDPGGKPVFREIRKNLSGLMPINQLAGMVLSHQDPDVAASIENWLELKSDLWIFSTPRTHVLLPYYCFGEYRLFDVEKEKRFHFKSGNELFFIPSPFLHFPGAVTTLDSRSGYLFSGDVWASLDTKEQFVVENFIRYSGRMDLFHKDYMASNVAARGYADSLKGYIINGILPQHGSMIPGRFVEDALNYLENIECGLDIIYPLIGSFSMDGCDLYAAEKFIDDKNTPEEKVTVSGEECSKAGAPHSTTLLQEALNQAGRHAAMKDKIIHNLRIAEFCLQKSETRLKEAQALGHIGHWVWDISSGELTWSDEVYRILGYKVKEIKPTYEAFLQMVHPDDRRRLEHTIEKAVSKDTVMQVPHRIVRPGGEVRTVHERGEVKRDQLGNAVFMLGTVQDITDFSSITQKLADSNILIDAIRHMQFRFIENNDLTEMYNQLLNDFLQLTKSRYGFIGDVLVSPGGEPHLFVHTLTNLSWDKESEELHEKVKGKVLEFHSLDNLFGVAITSGEPLISNDPVNDPRGRGVPPGHPEIHCLLVVPVMYGSHVVGLLSLANRKDGYSPEIVEYIAPLVTALAQVIVARQDQKARRATEKILEKEAKIDGLLGIPNRRYFNEYIELQIKNALRAHSPLSVIMIDVDFFKCFNDFYGHQKGDQCLVELARIMQASLHRPMDIVARYGGEEFCCILPSTSDNGAMHVAQNIKNRLARRAVSHAKSTVSDVVTVSMGIVTWQPESQISADDLVARADKALYEAKQTGRNCIVADFF